MAAMRRVTSTAIIIDRNIIEIFSDTARDQELGLEQPPAEAGFLIAPRVNRTTC